MSYTSAGRAILSALMLIAAGSAFAAGEIVTTTYPVPTPKALPEGVITGPDGNVWFTENGAPIIGRVVPSTGVITEFVVPDGPNGAPWDIIVGPDGALWYTDTNTSQIGRMTTDGIVTNLYSTLTPDSAPRRLTIGPDGAMWFTEYVTNQIGRITVQGEVTEFPIPTHNSKPAGITAGPDGALWFNENFGNQIVRMTTDGVITNTYPVPTPSSVLAQIVLGPDNNLWFSENGNNRIGRLNPTTGEIVEFVMPTAGSIPGGLIPAPDGALWFTEWESPVSQIGRITTDGQITEYPDGTPNSEPWEIAVGPGGTSLWYAEWRSDGMATAPICALGLTGSYSTSTGKLNLGFSLGNAQPWQWKTWVKDNNVSVAELWNKPVPVHMPLVKSTVAVSFPSTGGFITVYSGLFNPSGYAVCEESTVVSTVAQANTTTTLASSSNPSKLGQKVTFTATVVPATATGTVTYYHNGFLLGTATLSDGVATLTLVPPSGPNGQAITATYGGDLHDTPSSSAQVIQKIR